MTTDKEEAVTVTATALDDLDAIDTRDHTPEELRSALIRALAAADRELNRDIYDELADE